jgi:hypothetical protein
VVKKDWKGIWAHGLSELDIGFMERVLALISELVEGRYAKELRWVLKSNIFTHVTEKHVVECTKATRVLSELRGEEDMSSGL